MYKIYANGEPLHHPNLSIDGYICVSPVMEQAINSHGSLEFQITTRNPMFDSLKRRTTYISVFNDDKEEWRGRVIETGRNLNNVKTVYCEGELAYLCDSIRRPWIFSGTPKTILNELIYNHNISVDEARKFRLGDVTVQAPEKNVEVDTRAAKNTWQLISELLLRPLGGYLQTRKENGVVYLDYLEDFTKECNQSVQFGQNLLDLSETIDAQEIVTNLIPYGAVLSHDDPQYIDPPPSTGVWDANRLTIKSVNNGLDYIVNQTASEIWGSVWGSKIWDDISDPQELRTKAKTYLLEEIAEKITLQLRAADLSSIDFNVETIGVGMYVRAKSPLHDIDLRLLCKKKKTGLTEPNKTVIEIGAGKKTLTDLQGGLIADVP